VRNVAITFVVLTRNEAQRIGSCLGSVPPDAPVVLYDAQSTDETRTIARRRGADVVVAPWRGFVESRRAAAALVRTPWTFMLDADERLTPELAAELAALEPPPAVESYSVPRRNVFCGRWVRCAGWWPDRLVRLFRTGQASLSATPGQLHEKWSTPGDCIDLLSPIEHESYRSLKEYAQRFGRYTSAEARAMQPSVAKAALAWALSPARALWLLGPRAGLRDGWRGAFIAVASAAYPAVAATKALSTRRTL